MRVRLDDKHFLNSDQYCYWITTVVTPERGKPYERRVSGYTTTFRQVMGSYIEKALRTSETESYASLVAEVEDLKATVEMWLDAVGEIGDDRS